MTERIITRKQLKCLVPLSPSQIERLEKAGKFPKRVALGPGRVGWIESEVNGWIERQMAARNARSSAQDEIHAGLPSSAKPTGGR
ncbi:MAG: AlpA family phage regulatory protein [Hyphomicrobium sp.]